MSIILFRAGARGKKKTNAPQTNTPTPTPTNVSLLLSFRVLNQPLCCGSCGSLPDVLRLFDVTPHGIEPHQRRTQISLYDYCFLSLSLSLLSYGWRICQVPVLFYVFFFFVHVSPVPFYGKDYYFFPFSYFYCRIYIHSGLLTFLVREVGDTVEGVIVGATHVDGVHGFLL